MVEIYSKSLSRAFGELLHIKKLARPPIKTHKGDKKCHLFVNKQLFWWPTSITLDDNNDALVDFSHFILYHIPQLA